ncbi:helix-turn-helix domain-containing protein [Maridesulfovibrio bastinii]|uniref:helix-turn-helix domain-containing protein n=1 Tax=Maridesulfovibrio bastinii TaxID=47157 RepID=UPI000410350A|nr:helix-turn-helix transcriptional regulator [Maridesulfovibrio bastinii]
MMSAGAVNPHAGVKTGRKRRPFLIKEWMDAKGYEQKDIAAAAGIKAQSIVSRTIRGGANNRKVLTALRNMGCPEKYLALPDDMHFATSDS